MSNLKSGYTTGTHATAAVMGVIYEYLYKKELEYVELTLPNQTQAIIEVQKLSNNHYQSIKTDNDDLDVTKGAAITAKLLFTPPQDLKSQTPAKLQLQNATLFLYGGDGVGIVTKKGLKIAPTYPAINPTPLKMIEENLQDFPLKDTLHIVLSIKNGEIIAKETANEKVGVVGGLSILGTTGIVKPISSEAYIQSIKAEIEVAKRYCESLVFTLGNSAFEAAKKSYDATCVIEVGNFVYDSLQLAKDSHVKKIIFLTAVAKMAKVAQGAKNTHNRFGGLDFKHLKRCLEQKCGVVRREEFLTLKALLETLSQEQKECLERHITQQAQQQLTQWSENSIEITTQIIKVQR